MLCRHIKMMLPLNLNPQLNATGALWANDSTLESIIDTDPLAVIQYVRIMDFKFNCGRCV